jgi:hypothetical protein
MTDDEAPTKRAACKTRIDIPMAPGPHYPLVARKGMCMRQQSGRSLLASEKSALGARTKRSPTRSLQLAQCNFFWCARDARMRCRPRVIGKSPEPETRETPVDWNSSLEIAKRRSCQTTLQKIVCQLCSYTHYFLNALCCILNSYIL